jgi:membrane associated rhomboid family serine protease
MEKLLSRLELKLGRFAIQRLTTFIVGGMALAFVLSQVREEFLALLVLDLHQVAHGQVWRLVTYLFVPPAQSPIWLLFALYMTWLIGSNLENEWGAFKFNVFYLLGMLGTTAAALITGHAQGNTWINASLFFAFATVFPDFQILIFFVLPVRVKWLGMIAAAGIVYQFAMGDLSTRAAIGAAMINYLLFFGGHLAALVRGRRLSVRQAARRTSMRPAPPAQESKVCAMCGARQEDGADIRVCTCEKCGGPRQLCLEHARNH